MTMIGSKLVINSRMAAIVFLALFLLGQAATASPSRYTVTDLGTAAGAELINAAGQVVIQYGETPQKPLPRVILWQDGRQTEVGRLDPRGLNDKGEIAGYDAHDRVVVWRAGRLHHPHLPYLAVLSDQNCLNNAGWLGGQIRLHGPDLAHVLASDFGGKRLDRYAFLWDGRRCRRLSPRAAAFAKTEAINDHGQAVVISTSQSNQDSAFLWDAGRRTLIQGLPKSLPNLSVNSLNNQGQAIIEALHAAHSQVYLWQKGHLLQLQPPPGGSSDDLTAFQVDDRGQAVGDINVKGGSRAILWNTGSGVGVDLNSDLPAGSGWTLENASGINARGQIIGFGMYRGKDHAYLLTPR